MTTEYQLKCHANEDAAMQIFQTSSYPEIFLMVQTGKINFDVFSTVLDLICDNGYAAGFADARATQPTK